MSNITKIAIISIIGIAILLSGCIESDVVIIVPIPIIESNEINSINEIESQSILPQSKLNISERMEILKKYDTDRDGILNNEEKQPITDLYNRDMLTPKQVEAYIAIWGYPKK